MHQVLEQAASGLGVLDRLPNLQRAAATSRGFVTEAKTRLQEAAAEEALDLASLPLDVVAFGSYARDEASGESDFDYLVIAHGLCDDPTATRLLLKQADLLRHPEPDSILFEPGPGTARKEIAGPGSTGMFGRVVSAPDLVERIGLEQDTNQSHTVRMLLLQESTSLLAEDRHEHLVRVMIRRYLADYPTGKTGPPRFLLSDVLRYWRTVSVDYAAKRYEQISPEWGLRYLKLVLSRKIAYAGTLASLLLCDEGTRADEDYLYGQFAMPPLARLAQVHEHLEDERHRRALQDVLLAADWFNGRLGEGRFREDMKKVTDRASDDPAFRQAIDISREVQSNLELVFFDAPCLKSNSVSYLAF